MSSIFDSAVRTKRLATNPCKSLERAYVRQQQGKRQDGKVKPDEILNPDEIRRLIDAAKPGLERTLIVLAAATGARSGELLALQWSDVTLAGAKPSIAIRQSLSWAKGPTDAKVVSHIGPPKSEAGDRNVPIDATVAHLLKRWKMQTSRNPLDLVFADDDGKPIKRSNFRHDVFLPALQRAGLKHVTFHSLRHSFASGLIQRGAPGTEVQHLLGHKKPSVTLDVYSHWFNGADSGAAATYSAELFSGPAVGVDTKWTLAEAKTLEFAMEFSLQTNPVE